MSARDTKELVELAVKRFQAEVPALAQLKLVVGLELRGRGDIQPYRVEVPGPIVTKGPAADAKVRVSASRSHFNELASEGKLKHWHEAYVKGDVKATGPEQILTLVGNVIARQEGRERTSKTRR